MRRTKEEAEITKQNILAAGLEVFSRNGYKGTRVEDIAKQANVTTGAIYHHFGGKSELFIALVEKSETKANQLALQVIEEGGSPATVLRRLLVSVFKFIEQDREYRAMYELFINMNDFSPDLSSLSEQSLEGRRQLTRYFSNLIIEGIDAGEFDPHISPKDAALALVGFINGMVLIWVQDPDHFSIKERAEKLVDLYLSGVVIRGH
jgi:TetR/AcrR family acrAB operon transcriptional repressor